MKSQKVNLFEIWLGIQGEGIYVGEQQLFIRMAGCNLNCQYCDTREALTVPLKCQVLGLPENFELSNPIEVTQLINLVNLVKQDKGVTVCLTGGEPLIQVKALGEFLIAAGPDNRFYLETNGVLYRQLALIIDLIDVVAMDIKLPSATGLAAFWDEHRRFLEIAAKREVLVKMVVSQKTSFEEVEKAISVISTFDSRIPLIFQPLSGSAELRVSVQQLFEYQSLALRKLKTVRIIPQVHKLMGWR